MNDLVTLNGDTAVTSTLAIAEGTSNEHASIIKLVRTYVAELQEFGGVGFQIDTFQTLGGPQQREYALLNEQQATLLFTFMRNSPIVIQFKVRLVKAFYELAQKARNPAAALTRLDLIKMALDSEQRALELEAEKRMLAADKAALEAQTAAQAPKVAAFDRIATSDGGMCITNAAKDLQVRPVDLFRWLQANQWIYRRQGGQGYVAYQNRIQQGLLEHKVTTVERSDGSSKSVEQVRVTPKGLAKLAELLPQEQAA